MESGEALTRIARFDIDGNPRQKGDFPAYSTIYQWGDPDNQAMVQPEFVKPFAEAKLCQHRFWIEETLEIADNPSIGYQETIEEITKQGVAFKKTRTMSADMIEHRRLRIDTRFKLAARMDPQKWAERLQGNIPPDSDPDRDVPKIVVEGGLPDDLEGK